VFGSLHHWVAIASWIAIEVCVTFVENELKTNWRMKWLANVLKQKVMTIKLFLNLYVLSWMDFVLEDAPEIIEPRDRKVIWTLSQRLRTKSNE
jgi:hypothetical protein